MKLGKSLLAAVVAGLFVVAGTASANSDVHQVNLLGANQDSMTHMKGMKDHKGMMGMSKMDMQKHHEMVMKVMTEEKNKQLAETFWDEVFNKHNTAVIETMVGDNYKQHSPGFADGKQAFLEGAKGFLASAPESSAVIDNIGADGDYVYIHNHIKMNKDDRGQAAMDIFKIVDGKIVEHWDVIQDVPEKAENPNGMFFHESHN